jgi:peroxiredoxin
MNSTVTRTLSLSLAVLSVAACNEKPAGGETQDNPAGAASPAATASAATPKATRSVETKSVADDKLGTLPEGVGVAVGSPAPDARLIDSEGKAQNLAELWKKGKVLVVFYRGGWCPFCNFQVRGLTQAFLELQKRGVTPVVISVDQTSEASKTQATYSIPFPVLSDPDLTAHKAFRVVQEVDDATVERYKGMGIDLEKSSGRKHHTIAIPAMFLVDEKGVVRWAHADRDYKIRPTTDQLLGAIERAGSS